MKPKLINKRRREKNITVKIQHFVTFFSNNRLNNNTRDFGEFTKAETKESDDVRNL